jgi:hypothetical protein
MRPTASTPCRAWSCRLRIAQAASAPLVHPAELHRGVLPLRRYSWCSSAASLRCRRPLCWRYGHIVNPELRWKRTLDPDTRYAPRSEKRSHSNCIRISKRQSHPSSSRTQAGPSCVIRVSVHLPTSAGSIAHPAGVRPRDGTPAGAQLVTANIVAINGTRDRESRIDGFCESRPALS